MLACVHRWMHVYKKKKGGLHAYIEIRSYPTSLFDLLKCQHKMCLQNCLHIILTSPTNKAFVICTVIPSSFSYFSTGRNLRMTKSEWRKRRRSETRILTLIKPKIRIGKSWKEISVSRGDMGKLDGQENLRERLRWQPWCHILCQ